MRYVELATRFHQMRRGALLLKKLMSKVMANKVFESFSPSCVHQGLEVISQLGPYGQSKTPELVPASTLTENKLECPYKL